MEGGKREADSRTSRECYPSSLGEVSLEIRRSAGIACARRSTASTGGDARKGRARGQIVEKGWRTRSIERRASRSPGAG